MPTKVCSQCRVTKPLDQFSRSARQSDGHQRRCKACFSAYNKARYAADPERFKLGEAARRRTRGVPVRRTGRDPERLAAWRFAKRCEKYGVTVEWFRTTFEAQGGRCAICRSESPGPHDWHIDHDHATGSARQLLCHLCNVMLGNARDDPSILLAGADYLRQHAGRLG